MYPSDEVSVHVGWVSQVLVVDMLVCACVYVCVCMRVCYRLFVIIQITRTQEQSLSQSLSRPSEITTTTISKQLYYYACVE